MNNKEKAQLILSELNLTGWHGEGVRAPNGYFVDIVKDDAESKSKLKFSSGVHHSGKLSIRSGIVSRVKSIEYIYEKFFEFNKITPQNSLIYETRTFFMPDQYDHNQLLELTESQIIIKSLPIWKRHYEEELLPVIAMFKDLNAVIEYDVQLESKKEVFQGPYSVRRLIAKKLTDDTNYKKYVPDALWEYKKWKENAKNEYDLKSLESREKSTVQLISFLDTLDVERYLHERPWMDESRKDKSEPRPSVIDPMVLHRTSMFVINTAYSPQDLAKLFGANSFLQIEESRIGAISEMNLTDVGMINMLTWSKPIIGLIQHPLQCDALDMKEASKKGEAFQFLIDETSMTMSYDYYKGGKLMSSKLEVNGELLHEKNSISFHMLSVNVEEMIHRLFYHVSGRELKKIDMIESVERWKLID